MKLNEKGRIHQGESSDSGSEQDDAVATAGMECATRKCL